MRAFKVPAAVMAFALVLAGFPAAAPAEAALSETEFLTGVEGAETETEEDLSTVSKETFPCYYDEVDVSFDLPVYFVNGVTDFPFMNLYDWIDVMVTVYRAEGYEDYDLSIEADENVVMLTRENGYSMLVDFKEKTISFEDYDAFTHIPGENALLDMVASDFFDEDGNPVLYERIDRGSFDRYGSEIELDLSAYEIPLYWSEEDALYLVPLQTLGDFLLSLPRLINVFFNEEALFLTYGNSFGTKEEGLTELGELYYSVPAKELSEELAWYSYCELCLAMDQFYGLKEIHDFTSFDQIFRDTAYREDLCSTDPDIKDGALYDFINYYLDDLHSGFNTESFRTQEIAAIGGEGLSSQQDSVIGTIYYDARAAADHEISSYEEVGNTAYITFDHFVMTKYTGAEYYEDLEIEEDPASEELDTVSLILYAHEQITREDSPIENVVIDLSLNGGGAIDAAACVCAWYLGEASFSIRSSMTGAVSTGKYRVDTNLDGVFDEADTVSDRNLYCLIGPYSFSCGNLVPNVFRSSGRVTLLGGTSGGGSCSVLPMSTAYGTSFNISSPKRMSYLKNGSYYDIDTGIEPDCYIVKPKNYYDREALTDYINQLF